MVGPVASGRLEGPVRAEAARTLGSGLLREAIALRGRMDLTGYERPFPAQDVLPAGGIGSLVAAPLQGRLRKFVLPRGLLDVVATVVEEAGSTSGDRR